MSDRPKCKDCGTELHAILKPNAHIYYACVKCKTTWVDFGNGDVQPNKVV